MKIWKFVITGGPCAGKTEAIKIIKQELTNKGLKVIAVPETATELISSEITPWELGRNKFQFLLLERSLNKEITAEKAAESFNQDVVIIYDRGLLDGKAYMQAEPFMDELKKYNEDEKTVLDRYNAVFHLVTTANGAEDFYTLANNEARTESIKDAIKLDDRLIDIWSNHKNFKIIDNSTNFELKMERLLKEIDYAINNYDNN